METKLWFKTKLHGWGFFPATKEGWLTLFEYAALIVVSEIIFIEYMYMYHPFLSVVLFVLFVSAATAMLLYICYTRGEKPRWHWVFEE